VKNISILLLMSLFLFSCTEEEILEAQSKLNQKSSVTVSCSENAEYSSFVSEVELLLFATNKSETNCIKIDEKEVLAGSIPCIQCERNIASDKPKDDISVCPAVYKPVCGDKPFYCPNGKICPTLASTQKTYSNSCELNKAGAKFVHEGECGSLK